ncbi:MAG: hypothetical protein KGY54_03370 [Oleiphilaceae bacterium]|nr:hypothetical protein [Oleiphilaceae bacterium]
MITAIHRKKLLPILIMLFAMIGMSFSVIGKASSHGVAELAETSAIDHDDHAHGHDEVDEKSDVHLHHDTGNHTHESVDDPTISLLSGYSISLRQSIPFAEDSPRSFRYRLDRPPKTSLAV